MSDDSISETLRGIEDKREQFAAEESSKRHVADLKKENDAYHERLDQQEKAQSDAARDMRLKYVNQQIAAKKKQAIEQEKLENQQRESAHRQREEERKKVEREDIEANKEHSKRARSVSDIIKWHIFDRAGDTKGKESIEKPYKGGDKVPSENVRLKHVGDIVGNVIIGGIKEQALRQEASRSGNRLSLEYRRENRNYSSETRRMRSGFKANNWMNSLLGIKKKGKKGSGNSERREPLIDRFSRGLF